MKKTILLLSLLLIPFLSFASTINENISLIEQGIDGVIGVSVLDTDNLNQWHYNGNQRFPMMSTFKTIACAKMLQSSENNILDKNKKETIQLKDIIEWSPITKKLVGKSITLEDACKATMLTSDNTAANIILSNIGGPKSVTKFFRSLNDNISQLNRIEPNLNQALPGDTRDTTTPNAMNNNLNKILFGNYLSVSSQNKLKHWMIENKVSNNLLRSILPKGWNIADRSGAGGNGSRGINAVIWSKQKKPIIISIYITQTNLSISELNLVINDIGKIILEEYSIKGIN